MKKYLIILVLCLPLLMFQEANAQFGVRLGSNYSNFDGFDFDSRIGLHAGAYYGISFLDKVVIEPGVFYSQKGYKYHDPAGLKENINYLDVPVLVRYKIIGGLNVFAGPQASLLINRNRHEGGSSVSKTHQIIKRYELGGVLGAGVNLPLGFNVQASYDMGMTNLKYFNYDVKNRVFKLSVGKDF